MSESKNNTAKTKKDLEEKINELEIKLQNLNNQTKKSIPYPAPIPRLPTDFDARINANFFDKIILERLEEKQCVSCGIDMTKICEAHKHYFLCANCSKDMSFVEKVYRRARQLSDRKTAKDIFNSDKSPLSFMVESAGSIGPSKLSKKNIRLPFYKKILIKTGILEKKK